MSAIVLYEDDGFANLLPLLFWRSVFELQIGRKIQLDRIAQRLGLPVAGVWTRDWLAPVASLRCGAPANRPIEAGTVLVNGRWLCDEQTRFPPGPRVGVVEGGIAYIVCDASLASKLEPRDLLDAGRRETGLSGIETIRAAGKLICYPWDVIAELDSLLIDDWQAGDAVIEVELDPRVGVASGDQVHIGLRTLVHPTAVIDASAGPVFVSHDVRVGAHAVIEGPVYVGPGTQVHPHAWLHGGTSIGPVCKVGGEIDACVIHGYTNKQHAGFLGHAYVGSWVNIGAGSVNSDLKHTYGHVRVPVNGTEVDTGQRLFGAVIGDHAKIGINATIPTGAVIGMAAVIASTRILPKFVPSFAWVTDDGLSRGDAGRLLDVATAVMARRSIDMTDDEVELFLDLGNRVRAMEQNRTQRASRFRGDDL